MSYEVEIKFRVADAQALTERVKALGGQPIGTTTQMDTYFSHPARDFAETDEVLRIRSGPEGNALTFKGAKWGGPTKTREEIEVEFAAGPEESHRMARLLDRLGFESIAVIGKGRASYELVCAGRTIHVAIDEAWNLGWFAEVETLVASEVDVAAAQAAVIKLAGELGLDQVEPRSYLRMSLERKGQPPQAEKSAGPA